MSNPTTPPKGQMQLFDYLTVPLDPGIYRLHVESQVTHDPGQTATMTNDGYFDVVGPRFSLSPSDVAGTYPPRNGHGPFSDSLAQVVLKRRALPWERKLDAARPGGPLPAPSGGNQLAPGYPRPWMTLLVFEEGEYTLLPGVPLDKVMPKANFVALGSPAGITCGTACSAGVNCSRAMRFWKAARTCSAVTPGRSVIVRPLGVVNTAPPACPAAACTLSPLLSRAVAVRPCRGAV